MVESNEKQNIHFYERKSELWISGFANVPYADIVLPIGTLEFHLKENRLISSIDEASAMCNAQNQMSPFWINGIWYYGGAVDLQNGDMLYVGAYIITFFENYIVIEGDISEANINLTQIAPKQDIFTGYPYYKRSPRIIYRLPHEKIEIKSPPKKKEFSKGGLVQLIVPVLTTTAFTVAMGFFLKRGPYMYMSVGMTVITLIFSIKNFFSDRKDIRDSNSIREKTYWDYLLKVRKEIREKRQKERIAFDYISPTVEDIQCGLKYFNNRLYERTLTDDDFMQVTLGYYTGKSGVEVRYSREDLETDKDELIDAAKEIPKEYANVEKIPLNISLRHAHLGLVGSKENVHEQLKILMLQLTFFQSYHDLEIVFIHDEKYKDEFSYIKWYPHLRIHVINVLGEICTENGKDTLSSLQQILKDRKQRLEEKKQEQIFKPHFLFIIDEPKMILNHPVMEYLQSQELNLGFSMIYTTDNEANLPENIKTVCLIENSGDGRLLLNEGERVNKQFWLQRTKAIDLEKMARTEAGIIHEEGISSRIPEGVTFFDMYGVDKPEEMRADQLWKKNQSHKSLAVPLGLRAKDDIVYLNLHEKAHGPHGLVAGTTGSGKSEIIQSYILSLAVNFHPYEVGFLLIDYKGGGMANLFKELPHLLGTITNLDKSESMRAMASIKSELSRRQQIFSDCGVNHINGYNKLFKENQVEEPLPHLFLISDEFAELKREQPDFMTELVSAARIGRSLGIHLILATQKPSGVVDDQIWSNSKFKLCLKVQSESDSKEMLKTPDAANITEAGRAYLQVGNNEIYELFQSAWSGATFTDEKTEEEKEDDRVYLLNELGQGELINQDLSGNSVKVAGETVKTQLDVTVQYLHDIYELEKSVVIKNKKTFTEVKKPWLPSLPAPMESPYTKEVVDSAIFSKGDFKLGIGMVDIPEEQSQIEYEIDLIKNGHILYMASSGYGKSLFLTNIIIGLAMKNAVRHLKFYIIDLGNSALIPLHMLPHVADYMGLDDSEKIEKFIRIITEEMSSRKKKFAKAMAQNISVYNETVSEPLSVIVIAIDNYDAIKEIGDGAEQFMQKLSRDGAGLGIYIITTLTRNAVMRASVMNNFKEKIAGFNFEASEPRTLIGRTELTLPEDKKGRALVKLSNINLMQLYTPVPCETELEYIENLKKLVRDIAEASSEKRAMGIPVLPEELNFNQISMYPGYEENENVYKIPVGIETENLNVQYIDLMKEPALIIGSSGTGRTNMLINIIQSLLQKSQPEIFIFDAKNAGLRELADSPTIHYAFDENSTNSMLEDIKELSDQRKKSYDENGKHDLTLQEYGKKLSPVYIIVDVVQELYERVGERADSIDILFHAYETGIFVIVSSDIKLRARTSKFLMMLTDCKYGVVLGSIREQTIFPNDGLREDNRDVRFGYLHQKGKNRKMMLPQAV